MTGVLKGRASPLGAGEGGGSIPAPLGRRALARLIDFALGLIAFAALLASGEAEPSRPSGTGIVLVAMTFTFVMSWVYEVVPVAIWGQTFGKLVMGIRVVVVDDGRPGFLRALRRSLLPMVVLAAFFPLYPVVFIAAGFFHDHRGPHDRLAGTSVVRSDSGF